MHNGVRTTLEEGRERNWREVERKEKKEERSGLIDPSVLLSAGEEMSLKRKTVTTGPMLCLHVLSAFP